MMCPSGPVISLAEKAHPELRALIERRTGDGTSFGKLRPNRRLGQSKLNSKEGEIQMLLVSREWCHDDKGNNSSMRLMSLISLLMDPIETESSGYG